MSVIRVGTTKKFADNWEHIFGGKKSKAATKKSTKKKIIAKLSGKKPSSKKTRRKTR